MTAFRMYRGGTPRFDIVADGIYKISTAKLTDANFVASAWSIKSPLTTYKIFTHSPSGEYHGEPLETYRDGVSAIPLCQNA